MKYATIALLWLAGSAAAVPTDHAERIQRGLDAFRTDVAPLLKEHCVKCHGGEKIKGDLDLTTREGLLKGGEEGPAIIPFDAAGSWMMKLIRHEDDPAMPEKKPKLSDEIIEKIAAWVDNGAPYDAPLVAGKKPPRDKSVVTEEDRKWWAFQPLKPIEVPKDAKHPIDAFLIAAGREKNLSLNPPAPVNTLIRRAALDVTGLPATPEMLAEFSDDLDDAKWGAFVDRLLDSPAYGERWARHWLDVARFAESSGFEHDYDRPYAFHYRDFVIKALNADMPFDQFARWQIAGDEFAPGDPMALMATGFLGAGVFPTQITANEVERTRYDALDDMLSTTGSAFLGLTIGCARCHDHKFDPIPTADYYRLLSTFTTTVRSNVDLAIDAAGYASAKAAFDTEHGKLREQLADYERGELRQKFDGWLKSRKGVEMAPNWTLLEVQKIEAKGGAKFEGLSDGSWLASGANPETDGYTIVAKTTQRQLTGLKLEALTHGSMKQKGPGRAGNGNFALSRIRITAQPLSGGGSIDVPVSSAVATHEQNKTNLSASSSLDDDAKSGWAVDGGGIGKNQAVAFTFATPVDFEGGAKLQISLEFAVNTGHSIGRPRLSVMSKTAPRLDGAPVTAVVDQLLSKATLGEEFSGGERDQLFNWWKADDENWRRFEGQIAGHAKNAPIATTKVMICAEGYEPIVMHSQGAPFLRETHVLKRGDTNQKVALAEQGFLQVLTRDGDFQRWHWEPPSGSQYAGRRRSLANWLTDVENGAGGLMARVIVNRLWQHHFGQGLVSTPNDFGKTGAKPSNVVLLDWLAQELIRNEWKLKPMHRLLLTSAAYRQATICDASKVSSDPDNLLFLRRTPQRLEAEAVRDSALAVSGKLDRTMYGPGSLDEKSRRRSVYFTVKRSRLLTSMVVFDAPEPLTSQGNRPTTTVAPQALLLMNSPEVREWAAGFAKRIEGEVQTRTVSHLVTQAYLVALSRPPSAEELTSAVGFIVRGTEGYQGAGRTDAETLAFGDFCQAILALNEFVYVN